MTEPAELTSLVEALAAADVEFVLVGGLAAVAQGAPITTHDVDIVHARSDENLTRLERLFARLHAYHRDRPAGERLPPSRAALAGAGHSLLMTDLGPLDVLGTIEEGLDYEALAPDAIGVDLAGRRLKLLSLATIVRLKRASRDPKDRLVLPVLEETLRLVAAGAKTQG